MFIDRLLNQGNAPVLERVLEFTGARQRLLTENAANLSTPGYRQKDLSVKKFQQMLRDRADVRREAAPGAVGFEDVQAELEHPNDSILFHDGNNRSVEGLMTESAKNALMHNLAIELMRKQFSSMEMALRERVG